MKGEEEVKELKSGGWRDEMKQPLHEGCVEGLRILGEARLTWQQAGKGKGNTGGD